MAVGGLRWATLAAAVTLMGATGCAGPPIANGVSSGVSSGGPSADADFLDDDDCGALIPSLAVASLPWTDAGPTSGNGVRCTVTASEGQISVSYSSESGPADQAFDAACSGLVADGMDPDSPSGYLTGTYEACTDLGRDFGETGVATSYVLSDAGVVGEVLIAVNTATPAASVRVAMQQLCDAVATGLKPLG